MYVRFELECVDAEPGERVLAVGSDAALGCWDVRRAPELELEPNKLASPTWRTRVPLYLGGGGANSAAANSDGHVDAALASAREGGVDFVEYKFAICGGDGHSRATMSLTLRWEEMKANRRLDLVKGTELLVRASWGDPKSVILMGASEDFEGPPPSVPPSSPCASPRGDDMVDLLQPSVAAPLDAQQASAFTARRHDRRELRQHPLHGRGRFSAPADLASMGSQASASSTSPSTSSTTPPPGSPPLKDPLPIDWLKSTVWPPSSAPATSASSKGHPLTDLPPSAAPTVASSTAMPRSAWRSVVPNLSTSAASTASSTPCDGRRFPRPFAEALSSRSLRGPRPGLSLEATLLEAAGQASGGPRPQQPDQAPRVEAAFAKAIGHAGGEQRYRQVLAVTPQASEAPVVIVSSEISPWSQTGGLGLVAASLAREFAVRGRRTMAVSPMYAPIAPSEGFKCLGTAAFRLQGKEHEVRYFHKHQPFGGVGGGCDFVLVDHECFGGRPHGLYCDTRTGVAYKDNLFRFAMLSLAALEAPLQLKPGGVAYGQRVVFLANDWQAGLIPTFMVHKYRKEGIYTAARSIYVVHNLGYQGSFPTHEHSVYRLLGLDAQAAEDLELGDSVNVSRGALLCADQALVVSPNYCAECLTPAGGFGLDDIVRKKDGESRVKGILNGIDAMWNPRIDKHIARAYGPEDFLEGRRECKAALQQRLGLVNDPKAALLGFVGRLAWQKGVDILGQLVPWLILDAGRQYGGRVQLVMMGRGDEQSSEMLRRAEHNHPGCVCSYVGFDPAIERMMMAGCDLILMPSRYEPCGLPQMIAQLYGALPVVTATGGLVDSVRGLEEGPERATGFLIPSPIDEAGLKHGLHRAISIFFLQPARFRQMQRNAMGCDFYWPRAMAEYETLLEETRRLGPARVAQ